MRNSKQLLMEVSRHTVLPTLVGFVLVVFASYAASAAKPPSKASAKPTYQPELRSGEITVGSVSRKYFYFIPKSASDGTKPLVIALHAGLGNAEAMAKRTRFNELAKANGFGVVYPQGNDGFRKKNRRTWNAGKCCGRSSRKNIDDVRYIDALIDRFVSVNDVDPKRVYITGFSNGAMMAYRYSCERPERIAAMSAAAGTMAVSGCEGGSSVPVLHIHGKKDNNVPLAGGKGSRSVAGVAHTSVPATMGMLAKSRQCNAEKSVSSGIEVTNYKCQRGAPVKLMVFNDMQHEWLDGTESATHLSWNFFSKFTNSKGE